MTLRKKVSQIDEDLKESFKLVGVDVDSIISEIDYLKLKTNKLEKMLVSVIKDQHRNTKVGPKTGRTYTTVNGKVNAIAKHLGLSFAVEPKKVVPAKIDIVKAKKSSK